MTVGQLKRALEHENQEATVWIRYRTRKVIPLGWEDIKDNSVFFDVETDDTAAPTVDAVWNQLDCLRGSLRVYVQQKDATYAPDAQPRKVIGIKRSHSKFYGSRVSLLLEPEQK